MAGRSDFLKDFAIGVPISTAMRERLVFIQEQCAVLQQENETLKARCGELEQQYAEIRRQTADATEAETFVDHRGAKFRVLPDGTVDRQVYCPKCRNPMATPAEVFLPYRCAPCHYLSPLKGFSFPAILDELPAPALDSA
jgi:hypothetical protein